MLALISSQASCERCAILLCHSQYTDVFSGTWLSDPLNEYLMGRRPVIFVAAIFSLLPMVGAAVCQDWKQLLVCRLLLGVGMGCKAAVGNHSQSLQTTKIITSLTMEQYLSTQLKQRRQTYEVRFSQPHTVLSLHGRSR
jgi:MFS family permease